MKWFIRKGHIVLGRQHKRAKEKPYVCHLLVKHTFRKGLPSPLASAQLSAHTMVSGFSLHCGLYSQHTVLTSSRPKEHGSAEQGPPMVSSALRSRMEGPRDWEHGSECSPSPRSLSASTLLCLLIELEGRLRPRFS